MAPPPLQPPSSSSSSSAFDEERKKRDRRRIRMQKMRKAERKQQQQRPFAGAATVARRMTVPTSVAATTSAATVKSGPSNGSGRVVKNDGWPKSSAESLPPLPGQVARGIVDGGMEFAVNDECTSLKLAPSGRHVVAGFTDGTLRLFDITGRLWSPQRGGATDVNSDDDEGLFDDDSSDEEDESNSGSSGASSKCPTRVEEEMRQLFDSSEDEEGGSSTSLPRSQSGKSAAAKPSISSPGPNKAPAASRKGTVCSKYHQHYGAVACQIYAKGVITSLLMDVGITEDGLFAFGGVLRGSMELVAVDLSRVELYHDSLSGKGTRAEAERDGSVDILDLIHVYRHSDAKLKGFGACTRLKKSGGDVEYRLFTGKGIKNIHIWSFIPPNATRTEPLWQCLYDTPTNGNTINFLSFRHDANGLLQGISKSDDQKLRVWDLSCEQYGEDDPNRKQSVIKQLRKAKKSPSAANQVGGRPKRPPYVDVTSTESTLGVFGPYAFSGGSDMYNQMSVICLDVEDVTTPYNHTELALPGQGSGDSYDSVGVGRRSRSGRQQRGDLKSIVNVAGLEFDAGHVLLELSDGSLVHYTQNSAQAHLELLSPDLYKTRLELEDGIDASDGEQGVRQMCLSRLGSEGIAVLATSTYNPITGKGTMMLKHIGASSPRNKKASGFWGFHGASILSVSKSFPEKKSASASNVTAVKEKARDDKSPISSDVPIETSKALVTPRQTRRKESERPRSAEIVIKPTEAIVTPSSRTISKEKKSYSSPTSDLPWQESKIVSTGVTVSPEMKADGSKQGAEEAPKARKGEMAKYLKGAVTKDRNRESAHKSKMGPSHKMSKIAAPAKVVAKAGAGEKNGEGRGRTKDRQDDNLSFLCDVATGQIKSPKISRKMPETTSPMKTKKNQRTKRSSSPPRWRNSAKSIDEFVASHHRHKRPRMHDLPTDTVSERMDVSRAPTPAANLHASSGVSDKNILPKHEYERRRLAAEHRACHEMLKKKLLTCTERQIRAWNLQNSNKSGNSPTYDKVRTWIDDTVSSHQDMLMDMLDRQRLEASAMVAMQTAENGGKQAAELQVSFPFPEIFSHVKDKVMGHFSHSM